MVSKMIPSNTIEIPFSYSFGNGIKSNFHFIILCKTEFIPKTFLVQVYEMFHFQCISSKVIIKLTIWKNEASVKREKFHWCLFQRGFFFIEFSFRVELDHLYYGTLHQRETTLREIGYKLSTQLHRFYLSTFEVYEL